MVYLLKEKKIIIYGTGIAGRKVCELLEKNNFVIMAFIDKRNKEINSFMNKPVYGMEDLSGISYKDSYAIIITIKNVYDHTEIAKQLLAMGFCNIICKSYDVLQGKRINAVDSMDKSYEMLLNQGQIYSEQIEDFKLARTQEGEDYGIISLQGDYVKTYVDVTLLFTNYKEETEWDSLNFVSTFPGTEMYRALEGKRLGKQDVIFSEFADFCAEGAIKGGIELSEGWKKNIIENRSNIYGEMKRMYSLRKDFFIENCPTFEYLENGKFRIVSSGKNRIAFLISQGEWYVPVKIRQDYYKKYINIEQVRVVANLLGNNTIWCSIPHPMFYNRKIIAHNYLNTWVPMVGRCISNYVKQKYGTYDFLSICVADYSEDDGAVSRHLRRMGCAVERKLIDTSLCRELDKLFGFRESEFRTKNLPVDVCIETHINERDQSDDVENSEELARVRFVLIGNRYRKQLFCGESPYYNKQLIFESVWDGEAVAGYMLLKNDE